MSLKLFTLVMTCVAITTLSQLFLKLGVSASDIQSQIAKGPSLQLVWTAAQNGFLLSGILLYALAAGFWMVVLSRADLSLVYPFVGLGFVLIMLLSWLVLNEPLNAAKLIGTLLIAIGVVIVAQS